MNLKDLIIPLAQKDKLLYQVLVGMIEEKDVLAKNLADLTTALTLPDNLYGHSHMPKTARLVRVSNQNIPANVPTAISFTSTSVYFDNDIMWDSAFPTRLTAKTPGKYLFGGCVKWADVISAWSLFIYIRRNGGNFIVGQSNVFTGDPVFEITASIIQNCSTEFEMARDDYVELVVHHMPIGAIVPLDVLAVADFSPVLWGCMVERARNQGPLTEKVPSGDFTR